ncbi:protein kinase [Ruegeria sp. 2205SS24-7]|uniref:serine/threonine protein kinase n=1 Tax=Ruegeria discodermiae TaxID=3064389 RepID=UPI0027425A2D|nr:serine/threonine protein kinase [Ruegeria sp. 2205SS24-7]MDP5217097.1 protein kinase [Ruegeria sp. 2205SS24-7]
MTESRAGDLFQPGDLVNNTYRIEAILGRGGTSDVYRARSEISGRVAALKVLKAEFSSNDDFLVLLTREEEIREIRHDAVVRYSENNRTPEGHVYLVMDFIDGPGLDQKLKQGPMPPDQLLTVCKRVCEGLEAAHARNIVHRDLSPDNIILRDGDPSQAVIIDFGIAKDTNPGAETIVGNEFAGKYAYAAPEQLSGKTDSRTDIYSLGALLLANFRGQSPQAGRNPMEVIENKKQPLDTEGVPEPLKSVIDKMTAPDPAERFQSATAVLQALSNGGPMPVTEEPALDDATVIVPRSSQAESDDLSVPPASIPPSSPPPSRPTATQESGGRGGLIAGGVVLAMVALGAGGYFGGVFDSFLGPSLPVVQPYTLVVEKREGLPPRATGFAPSEEVRAELTDEMTLQQGTADLTLASGDISSDWGQGVTSIVDTLADLDTWRLSVSGNSAEVSGDTTDRQVHDTVIQAFADGLPGGLVGEIDIELEPLFLASASVQTILDSMADCGPLDLIRPPSTGYGPDTPIAFTGTVAGEATMAALQSGLGAVAGDRPVEADVEVLNPTLCLIENFLPTAPPGPISIDFRNGGTDEWQSEDGAFVVGENPIIDVILPREIRDGYLSVSVIDVSGNVFHLLPNISRADNSIPDLRRGDRGVKAVRVAYSLEESEKNGGIAFMVDDSALGKSKVIAIHSDKPLFADMRPTTESATGYAEALRDRSRNQDTNILSLNSKILTTVAE